MFILGVIEDGLIAIYIKSVSKQKLFKASIYSLLIGFVQLFFIIVVINSLIAAIFNIFGSAVGTYYSKDMEKIIKKITKTKHL